MIMMILQLKKYIIVLILSLVRYDKLEHKKYKGNKKNGSFLPIWNLASAELSEYKKLMANISQNAMDIKYANLFLYCNSFILIPSSKTHFKIVLINNAIIM